MTTEWGAATWEPVPGPDKPSPPPEKKKTLAIVDPEPEVVEPEVVESDEADLAEADLSELAMTANRYHAEAETAARSALEAAWRAGAALLEAKARCKHGEWLPWLDGNFNGSKTTAQAYMRIASNTQHVALLDSDQSLRDAIKALCKTKREPKEPLLTVESFLRRLDALAEDARALRRVLLTTSDEVAAAMLKPLEAIGELYDQLSGQS